MAEKGPHLIVDLDFTKQSEQHSCPSDQHTLIES
jgi:hypothetical protein